MNLASALTNIRAAERFKRNADTILNDRIDAGGPLTSQENLAIVEQLACFREHMKAALDDLSESKP